LEPKYSKLGQDEKLRILTNSGQSFYDLYFLYYATNPFFGKADLPYPDQNFPFYDVQYREGGRK